MIPHCIPADKQIFNLMCVEQPQKFFEVEWKMDCSHKEFGAFARLLPGVRRGFLKTKIAYRLKGYEDR